MSPRAGRLVVVESYRGLLPFTTQTTVVTRCARNSLTVHGCGGADTALESASPPMTAPARLDAVLSPLGL